MLDFGLMKPQIAQILTDSDFHLWPGVKSVVKKENRKWLEEL
jgi:hypothetical protein